jgi:hypothetical protein
MSLTLCAVHQPAAGQMIAGSIRGGTTGQPVEGAFVQLPPIAPTPRDMIIRAVLNDSAGFYALPAAAGTFRLRIDRIGYETKMLDVRADRTHRVGHGPAAVPRSEPGQSGRARLQPGGPALDARATGAMDFRRLATGAWIIRTWRVRVPIPGHFFNGQGTSLEGYNDEGGRVEEAYDRRQGRHLALSREAALGGVVSGATDSLPSRTRSLH